MEKNLESVQFVNDVSKDLFNLKEHALLGISPFNSYYSEENLKKLFAWGLSTFKKINIFIPNEIYSYTLEALGYDKDKALKKTRAQDRYLTNKAVKALMTNGLDEQEAIKNILFFSDVSNNETYLKFYNAYKDLYENDKDFKDGCLLTSKWVLENKCDLKTVKQESLHTAAKYFLAELPLFLNSPEILNFKSSLFVYKDTPDFVSRIYNDSLFSHLPSRSQGYMEIKFE